MRSIKWRRAHWWYVAVLAVSAASALAQTPVTAAQSKAPAVEVIVIGGGIAGNALAAVLARTGRPVLVLERSLGLHETLTRAGGVHHTRFVPYDETVEPKPHR